MCIMLHTPCQPTPYNQPILPFWLHKQQKLKISPTPAHPPTTQDVPMESQCQQHAMQETNESIAGSTQGNRANGTIGDPLGMALVDHRINLSIHAIFVMILGKSRPMTQISPCCRNAIWKGRWSVYRAYSQLQTTRWRILHSTTLSARAVATALRRAIVANVGDPTGAASTSVMPGLLA